MSGQSHFDVVVIGGGIAGVSAAAEISEHRTVALVEMERQLAQHTTGRSAAVFFGSYGHPSILPLSQASLGWFEDPPDTDHPVLSPRGAITVAFDGGPLPELVGGVEIDAARVMDLVPRLRRDRVSGGVWEPDAADMDVAAIHQAYVRRTRRNGGVILTGHPVSALERSPGGWTVVTPEARIGADLLVDAAGAWADEVARLAGVPPVGLVPMRRTAFMVGSPSGSEEWPLVNDVDHTFYFKPDGPQLLCSPADETPSPPCDARPEEIDIALAIERINDHTDLDIRSVRSSWAGLRTFAPDRAMVIGPDPSDDRFVWLAGQGGTGIQTAPAAARLCAGLALDAEPPTDLLDLGLDLPAFDPGRFGA